MDTKTARTMLDCANDNVLAQKLNLTRQAISAWGGKVPQSRQWQIQLLAIKKPATMGGSEDCCGDSVGGNAISTINKEIVNDTK